MEKIKIKALAVDLDGTLLNRDESISSENLEALNMLREKNIEVIPVTGRPYVLAKKILGKHNIEVNHIICSNGGITYDANGNKIASYYMNKESGYELLSYLEEKKFPYAIFTDNKIYSHGDNESLIREDYSIAIKKDADVKVEMLDGLVNMFRRESSNKVDTYSYYNNINEDILGIIGLSLDKDKLKSGLVDLKDLKNITIGQSAFNNIEANSPDSNKGQALKKLLESLDIKIDEVMAIGDNTNDLAMLNIVPHSVAMGNAHDEIKKVCKYVTKNNDESGVAYAINTFIE